MGCDVVFCGRSRGAEAPIVAYDTELTYDKLTDATLLLQQNPHLTFLATHGDLKCPTEHVYD